MKTITFTVAEFGKLMNELGKLPHDIIRPIIDELDKFATAQLTPKGPENDNP